MYEDEWHDPTNSPTGCGTSELVYIGFDHAKVKTHNLSQITTGYIFIYWGNNNQYYCGWQSGF